RAACLHCRPIEFHLAPAADTEAARLVGIAQWLGVAMAPVEAGLLLVADQLVVHGKGQAKAVVRQVLQVDVCAHAGRHAGNRDGILCDGGPQHQVAGAQLAAETQQQGGKITAFIHHNPVLCGVFSIYLRQLPATECRSMTAKKMYVAFPASQALHERTQAFIKAVEDKPSLDHQALLSAIPSLFIDEVLAAFFAGPVDATGMTGSTASVIHGLMNMVGKASRALANKVLGKVTKEEQK